jgi:hypothetical protein
MGFVANPHFSQSESKSLPCVSLKPEAQAKESAANSSLALQASMAREKCGLTTLWGNSGTINQSTTPISVGQIDMPASVPRLCYWIGCITT